MKSIIFNSSRYKILNMIGTIKLAISANKVYFGENPITAIIDKHVEVATDNTLNDLLNMRITILVADSVNNIHESKITTKNVSNTLQFIDIDIPDKCILWENPKLVIFRQEFKIEDMWTYISLISKGICIVGYTKDTSFSETLSREVASIIGSIDDNILFI